jgi:hypothetical protein
VKKSPNNAEEKALIELVKSVYQPKGKEGLIKLSSLYEKIHHRLDKLSHFFKKFT